MAVSLRCRCFLIKLICYLLTLLLPNTLLAGEVMLAWDPPTQNEDGTFLSDLAGYTIYYGTASGDYSNNINVGNVTTYQVNNLADGYTYYFVVTAYNTSGNESIYSNEINLYISSVDISPPVISGVYADNITSHNATINWTTNEAADTQVEYGTSLSYEFASSLDPSLVIAHSQNISVAPSTQYNYRVTSRDTSGNVTVSGNHTFTSAALPDLTPPTISNIQVTNITPFSATIMWMTDEAATSQVEYGSNFYYGDFTSVDSTLLTIHSVDINGLTSDMTYEFRVRSMDRSYNEAISNNHSFRTSNIPPQINGFSADPLHGFAGTVINFSSNASDADGYIVQHEWDFDGDGNYDENTASVTSTSSLYTNMGIYNARLRITDNDGASAISDVVEIVIGEPHNQPPSILSVSATPYSGSAPLTVSFTVSASDPDGSIIRYEWDFDGNGTYEAETITNPITYVYNNPGTYYVKVRVTDDNNSVSTGDTVINVEKRKGGGRGQSSDRGNKKGKK